ncbi:NAD(P)/FAD-dependent oxidoreductase [Terrihabitans sp. B22-R8]|uniref:NAD(P)/FAD-dependent oxidoreductase n=1 Tax=Terrihabitans sp. B22-R8 TaxID=3425128 RepID=UPI00403C1FD1
MPHDSIFATDFKEAPYWWDAAPPEDAKDDLPKSADVVVVGSGYAGLSAAAELAAAGRHVVVLDGGPLGFGASTRSGGMVSSAQKLVVSGAIKGVAKELVEPMLDSSVECFDHIKTLIEREKLDADFMPVGRFFGAHTPGKYAELCDMGRILEDKNGVSLRIVPKAEQRSVVGTDYFHGGIVINDYAGVHPAKYNRALRNYARRCGAELYSHAAVTSIDRQTGFSIVKTERGDLRAEDVFVATNGYTRQATPALARRVIPVKSYQIATEPLDKALMDEMNPGRRMVSDTRREVIYTRPSPDGTRMLFGWRPDPRDIDDIDAAAGLLKMAREVWPQLGDKKISHVWSGYVGMTFDKTPHMGEIDGVHYAMGCNGSGVAMMTYLGHQTALKILRRQNKRCGFDRPDFPTNPLYNGNPWFIPIISGYYHVRDRLDRLFVKD